MRLFTALKTGGDIDILTALADDGFVPIPADDFDGEDRFSVAVTGDAGDNDRVWIKWRPQLIFSASKAGINSKLYNWHTYEVGAKKLFLGVLSDRPFVLPGDWYLDYRCSSDDSAVFLKALADYSYRYVLAEAMAENAEWCGHMSSVVHRL